MDKSPDAFRTISEVAEFLDTPAHVLRFWESRFPQIKPVKRAGGRRYYRPTDIALLTGIKRLLHDEGLTIRGVQKILRDDGVREVGGLPDDTVSLDEPALWIDQVFDVKQALDIYIKPRLLLDFSRGGLFIALFVLDATAGSDPKVVSAGPHVVNHEKAILVFDDGSGGDAVRVQL